MIRLFWGTDRDAARAALAAELGKLDRGVRVVHITDANTVEDLRAALSGGLIGQVGIFAEKRAVVLDSICANDEMRRELLSALGTLQKSLDPVYLLEGKLDADTRKRLEKFAESSEKFDSLAAKKGSDIFTLANALRRGDRKTLWIRYREEIAGGSAPEAIHGVLFWGAKDAFLKARDERSRAKAKGFVAVLAALPHDARRRGEDLEYALERFVLSVV